MQTGYLFAPLAAATMTLAVPNPAASCSDDREAKAFCLSMTHRSVRANAQAGKWLDRVTRHDGVVVDCEDKRIEFKRFTSLVPAGRTGDAWREAKEKEWNAAHCTNAVSRQAIDKGWTVRASYTMASGENVSFNADCD